MNDRMNQGVAAAVVVFLLAGAWYLGLMQGRAETTKAPASSGNQSTSTLSSATNTTSNSQTTPSVVSSGNDSVTVANQSAGSKVTISSVTLPARGWVAVRDESGHVLGAARLESGTSQNVVVELLRATAAGGKYQVLLYTDDGDNVYDLHKDSMVMRADASVAGAMFSAQ